MFSPAVRAWFEADAALAARIVQQSTPELQQERATGREAIKATITEALEEVQARADSIIAATGDLQERAGRCTGAVLVRSAVLESCGTTSSPVCDAARDSTATGPASMRLSRKLSVVLTSTIMRAGRSAWLHRMARSPAMSIDYAVMEKSDCVSVIPVSMGWSDIGSWQSLVEASDKDASGNALAADVLSIDCTNTLVRSNGPKVAAIGVEGLVIVATPDAVLVMKPDQAQRVREAAEWFERQSKG